MSDSIENKPDGMLRRVIKQTVGAQAAGPSIAEAVAEDAAQPPRRITVTHAETFAYSAKLGPVETTIAAGLANHKSPRDLDDLIFQIQKLKQLAYPLLIILAFFCLPSCTPAQLKAASEAGYSASWSPKDRSGSFSIQLPKQPGIVQELK